jgi:hypothetical protein
MENINIIIYRFFQSKFSKPFLLAFLGYFWVAVYLSPELAWEEIQHCQILWNLILNIDPYLLNRFQITDLARYIPIRLICFLGFPATMGVNLAAFFGEFSDQKVINKPSMFCWVPLSHPQPFYPEIVRASIQHSLFVMAIMISLLFVIAFVSNKFLSDNYCKIHVQFLTTVLISVLSTLFIIVPYYEFTPCLNPEDSERLQQSWALAKLNFPVFITLYNPLFAFLFGYLGISITRRIYRPQNQRRGSDNILLN